MDFKISHYIKKHVEGLELVNSYCTCTTHGMVWYQIYLVCIDYNYAGMENVATELKTVSAGPFFLNFSKEIQIGAYTGNCASNPDIEMWFCV